jgi:RNA polymerase sigma-70 factor (ECF subfamily)
VGVLLSRARPAVVEVGSREPTAADLAMERYADGDDDAFGDLYDCLAPRLQRFLRRRVRRSDQVDDFMQQTLLAIHRARGSFIRGAAVMPWAFAIARRLVIDAARRKGREISLDPAEQAQRLAELVAVGDEADEILLAKALARAVGSTLFGLPESQRLAYELVKVDGLSCADAAEVLGVSVGTLKVRVHRAVEALRETVEKGSTG